ncbi:MAG: GIY-YIG nuclease family protein [Parachlamydiaceae bacterium]|nr:GIY-YIG nuclease family protein [Parachlamydiaceae bacterium]
MIQKTWTVYIIQTYSGKLYTGITNCLEQRLKAHSSQSKGAKFFRFSPPQKIIYSEAHPNRSEASKRESAIKKMTRLEKIKITSK